MSDDERYRRPNHWEISMGWSDTPVPGRNTPTTPEGWNEAFNAQADEVLARDGVTEFDRSDVHEQSFYEWAGMVALKLQRQIPELQGEGASAENAQAAVVAGSLITGFELGLWMARTGRVVFP